MWNPFKWNPFKRRQRYEIRPEDRIIRPGDLNPRELTLLGTAQSGLLVLVSALQGTLNFLAWIFSLVGFTLVLSTFFKGLADSLSNWRTMVKTKGKQVLWDGFIYCLSLVRLFFAPVPYGPLSKPLISHYDRNNTHIIPWISLKVMTFGWLVTVSWLVFFLGVLGEVTTVYYERRLIPDGFLHGFWIATLVGSGMLFFYDWKRQDIERLLLIGIAVIASYVAIEQATTRFLLGDLWAWLLTTESMFGWHVPFWPALFGSVAITIHIVRADLFRTIRQEQAGNYFQLHSVIAGDSVREKSATPPQLIVPCIMKLLLLRQGIIHFPAVPERSLPAWDVEVVRPMWTYRNIIKWSGTTNVAVVRDPVPGDPAPAPLPPHVPTPMGRPAPTSYDAPRKDESVERVG